MIEDNETSYYKSAIPEKGKPLSHQRDQFHYHNGPH